MTKSYASKDKYQKLRRVQYIPTVPHPSTLHGYSHGHGRLFLLSSSPKTSVSPTRLTSPETPLLYHPLHPPSKIPSMALFNTAASALRPSPNPPSRDRPPQLHPYSTLPPSPQPRIKDNNTKKGPLQQRNPQHQQHMQQYASLSNSPSSPQRAKQLHLAPASPRLYLTPLLSPTLLYSTPVFLHSRILSPSSPPHRPLF